MFGGDVATTPRKKNVKLIHRKTIDKKPFGFRSGSKLPRRGADSKTFAFTPATFQVSTLSSPSRRAGAKTSFAVAPLASAQAATHRGGEKKW